MKYEKISLLVYQFDHTASMVILVISGYLLILKNHLISKIWWITKYLKY